MNKRQYKKYQKNYYRLTRKQAKKLEQEAKAEMRAKGFKTFEEYAKTLLKIN